MKFLTTTLLFLVSLSFAQTEPDSFSFFPSAVGNYWEYSNDTIHIVRDSLGEDGSRFIFYQYPPSRFGADFKIDTSGNVFFLPEWNEYWLEYKLTADSGDTWMVKDYNLSGGGNRIQALVEDTYYISIFNTVTLAKRIEYYYLFNGDTTITESSWQFKTDVLASGFGLVWYVAGANQPTSLYGCIIDGKRYGTLVSVKSEEYIPLNTTLSQNYPNPFNSTTIIEYRLMKPEVVELALFNILGEKIAILESTFKQSGTYKYFLDMNEFSQGISSGIYIYQLKTPTVIFSQKMNYAK